MSFGASSWIKPASSSAWGKQARQEDPQQPPSTWGKPPAYDAKAATTIPTSAPPPAARTSSESDGESDGWGKVNQQQQQQQQQKQPSEFPASWTQEPSTAFSSSWQQQKQPKQEDSKSKFGPFAPSSAASSSTSTSSTATTGGGGAWGKQPEAKQQQKEEQQKPTPWGMTKTSTVSSYAALKTQQPAEEQKSTSWGKMTTTAVSASSSAWKSQQQQQNQPQQQTKGNQWGAVKEASNWKVAPKPASKNPFADLHTEKKSAPYTYSSASSSSSSSSSSSGWNVPQGAHSKRARLDLSSSSSGETQEEENLMVDPTGNRMAASSEFSADPGLHVKPKWNSAAGGGGGGNSKKKTHGFATAEEAFEEQIKTRDSAQHGAPGTFTFNLRSAAPFPDSPASHELESLLKAAGTDTTSLNDVGDPFSLRTQASYFSSNHLLQQRDVLPYFEYSKKGTRFSVCLSKNKSTNNEKNNNNARSRQQGQQPRPSNAATKLSGFSSFTAAASSSSSSPSSAPVPAPVAQPIVDVVLIFLKDGNLNEKEREFISKDLVELEKRVNEVEIEEAVDDATRKEEDEDNQNVTTKKSGSWGGQQQPSNTALPGFSSTEWQGNPPPAVVASSPPPYGGGANNNNKEQKCDEHHTAVVFVITEFDFSSSSSSSSSSWSEFLIELQQQEKEKSNNATPLATSSSSSSTSSSTVTCSSACSEFEKLKNSLFELSSQLYGSAICVMPNNQTTKSTNTTPKCSHFSVRKFLEQIIVEPSSRCISSPIHSLSELLDQRDLRLPISVFVQSSLVVKSSSSTSSSTSTNVTAASGINNNNNNNNNEIADFYKEYDHVKEIASVWRKNVYILPFLEQIEEIEREKEEESKQEKKEEEKEQEGEQQEEEKKKEKQDPQQQEQQQRQKEEEKDSRFYKKTVDPIIDFPITTPSSFSVASAQKGWHSNSQKEKASHHLKSNYGLAHFLAQKVGFMRIFPQATLRFGQELPTTAVFTGFRSSTRRKRTVLIIGATSNNTNCCCPLAALYFATTLHARILNTASSTSSDSFLSLSALEVVAHLQNNTTLAIAPVDLSNKLNQSHLVELKSSVTSLLESAPSYPCFVQFVSINVEVDFAAGILLNMMYRDPLLSRGSLRLDNQQETSHKEEEEEEKEQGKKEKQQEGENQEEQEGEKKHHQEQEGEEENTRKNNNTNENENEKTNNKVSSSSSSSSTPVHPLQLVLQQMVAPHKKFVSTTKKQLQSEGYNFSVGFSVGMFPDADALSRILSLMTRCVIDEFVVVPSSSNSSTGKISLLHILFPHSRLDLKLQNNKNKWSSQTKQKQEGEEENDGGDGNKKKHSFTGAGAVNMSKFSQGSAATTAAAFSSSSSASSSATAATVSSTGPFKAVKIQVPKAPLPIFTVCFYEQTTQISDLGPTVTVSDLKKKAASQFVSSEDLHASGVYELVLNNEFVIDDESTLDFIADFHPASFPIEFKPEGSGETEEEGAEEEELKKSTVAASSSSAAGGNPFTKLAHEKKVANAIRLQQQSLLVYEQPVVALSLRKKFVRAGGGNRRKKRKRTSTVGEQEEEEQEELKEDPGFGDDHVDKVPMFGSEEGEEIAADLRIDHLLQGFSDLCKKLNLSAQDPPSFKLPGVRTKTTVRQLKRIIYESLPEQFGPAYLQALEQTQYLYGRSVDEKKLAEDGKTLLNIVTVTAMQKNGSTSPSSSGGWNNNNNMGTGGNGQRSVPLDGDCLTLAGGLSTLSELEFLPLDKAHKAYTAHQKQQYQQHKQQQQAYQIPAFSPPKKSQCKLEIFLDFAHNKFVTLFPPLTSEEQEAFQKEACFSGFSGLKANKEFVEKQVQVAKLSQITKAHESSIAYNLGGLLVRRRPDISSSSSSPSAPFSFASGTPSSPFSPSSSSSASNQQQKQKEEEGETEKSKKKNEQQQEQEQQEDAENNNNNNTKKTRDDKQPNFLTLLKEREKKKQQQQEGDEGEGEKKTATTTTTTTARTVHRWWEAPTPQEEKEQKLKEQLEEDKKKREKLGIPAFVPLSVWQKQSGGSGEGEPSATEASSSTSSESHHYNNPFSNALEKKNQRQKSKKKKKDQQEGEEEGEAEEEEEEASSGFQEGVVDGDACEQPDPYAASASWQSGPVTATEKEDKKTVEAELRSKFTGFNNKNTTTTTTPTKTKEQEGEAGEEEKKKPAKEVEKEKHHTPAWWIYEIAEPENFVSSPEHQERTSGWISTFASRTSLSSALIASVANFSNKKKEEEEKKEEEQQQQQQQTTGFGALAASASQLSSTATSFGSSSFSSGTASPNPTPSFSSSATTTATTTTGAAAWSNPSQFTHNTGETGSKTLKKNTGGAGRKYKVHY